MNILALDLATKCGWAKCVKGKITYGTEDFVNRRFDGAGVCYLKFRNWLIEETADIDLVAYEGVMMHLANAVDAQHKYGGFMATMMAVCEGGVVPYTAFGVGEIKKFWTGRGNADKKDMIKAAFKRGFNPKDDNAADALAILHMAVEAFSFC